MGGWGGERRRYQLSGMPANTAGAIQWHAVEGIISLRAEVLPGLQTHAAVRMSSVAQDAGAEALRVELDSRDVPALVAAARARGALDPPPPPGTLPPSLVSVFAPTRRTSKCCMHPSVEAYVPAMQCIASPAPDVVLGLPHTGGAGTPPCMLLCAECRPARPSRKRHQPCLSHPAACGWPHRTACGAAGRCSCCPTRCAARLLAAASGSGSAEAVNLQ